MSLLLDSLLLHVMVTQVLLTVLTGDKLLMHCSNIVFA